MKIIIAQNLVDFEQLIAKCEVQIEKCKMKEKFILSFALCNFTWPSSARHFLLKIPLNFEQMLEI